MPMSILADESENCQKLGKGDLLRNLVSLADLLHREELALRDNASIRTLDQ